MKNKFILFLIIVSAFVSGCVTKPNPPIVDTTEYPLFLRYSYSDGYKWELWKRADGSLYFKRGNRIMDYDNK